MSQFYPPSPSSLPEKFLKPRNSYYFRATLAFLGIILFFALYSALIYGFGLIFYWAVMYDMVYVNKLTILLKIGAIAGAGMLFLFALKFVFKLKNNSPKNRVKLKKSENPELWEFILQICKETGAPKPKNIYVDPDVNAYVAYANPWLSLFLPIRKELTIGMALAENVNLSEFKAIMTHEFGHFAQRSMRIGSYVMTANTIIHDMIFTRDRWDNILAEWRSSDIRLSAAAWAISPVIWLIRQLLNLFYQLLNIMYSSLSREMEFNADKYAVSTTGSDPIVSGLWKLDTAFKHWGEQINLLYLACQKNITPKNIYAHFHLISKKTSLEFQHLYQALPSSNLGGKQFFNHQVNSAVGMYASHPPNNLREANAKTPYISCETDDRSPLVLFGSLAQLQEDLTALIYEQYLNKKPNEYSEFAQFEAFKASELQHNHLHEAYEKTFEQRFLTIPIDLEIKAALVDLSNVPQGISEMKLSLSQLMSPIVKLDELMIEIQKMARGESKNKSITYKGVKYGKKELQKAFNLITQEKEEQLNTTFIAWDKQFCEFHYAIAKTIQKEDNLLALYHQHKMMVQIFRTVLDGNKSIMQKLTYLQSKGEVQPSELTEYQEEINEHLSKFNQAINSDRLAHFIPLPNIESHEAYKKSIVENGQFAAATGKIFENGQFDLTLQAIQTAINHLQRIDLASVGTILHEHHQLLEEYTATI